MDETEAPAAIDSESLLIITDIHIMVIEAIDSPRDLLAYISASPWAARLFRRYKNTILANLITKTLSHQAVQTAVRIHELIRSHHQTDVTTLGLLGTSVPDNYLRLGIGQLETIFRMCLFFEPLVDECMKMPLLRDRLYLKKLQSNPLWTAQKSFENIRERLERPEKGGVPLQARIYSGFFSLELAFRMGIGCWDNRVPDYNSNPLLKADDLGMVFFIVRPWIWYNNTINWATPDLTVDISLASIFVATSQGNFMDLVLSTGDVDAAMAVSPSQRRILRLFVCCNSHLPLSLGQLMIWNDQEGTMSANSQYVMDRIVLYNVIDRIVEEIESCVDANIPTPYTWQVGHCEPEEYEW